MSKRILVKESSLGNFFRSFFQAKADNNESKWLQALRKRNPKVADELAAWDDATTRSFMQQKKSLIKLGLDTTDVDAFAKKYGHNIG